MSRLLNRPGTCINKIQLVSRFKKDGADHWREISDNLLPDIPRKNSYQGGSAFGAVP